MPKIVTEREKVLMREAMLQKSFDLIRRKGVRNITVEDVTAAVGIGKGSFYSYYSTKEELLFATIKRKESQLFVQIEETLSAAPQGIAEKIRHALLAVYLSPESIVLYITPSNMEHLLRRLPPEYAVGEARKNQTNFHRLLTACGIDPEWAPHFPALPSLLNALHFIGSQTDDDPVGRQEAAAVLVDCVARYVETRLEADTLELAEYLGKNTVRTKS